MSMNRIYQGRISGAEIDTGTFKQAEWAAMPDWEDRVWEHHVIFQQAINYYLVALAALADSKHSQSRLVGDLLSRVKEAWSDFPRPMSEGAVALRESISEWLGLSAEATLEEAFKLILNGNEASPKVRTLALELLLEKCGGEAAIQQGGRGYFPRFCDAKASPSWDFSAEALQADAGKARLADVLHDDASEDDLATLANEMDLSWMVKVQPGKFYTEEESCERLREAVNHTRELVSSASTSRVAELVEAFPDIQESLEANLETISEIEWTALIPRNRKASKDLTFASLVFKYFPSKETAALLALFVKKPSSATQATSNADEVDFTVLGDDPIKLARGERGYVFPAFTALKGWKSQPDGEPVWKEFDIAAFKEALKSLNQFNQKTAERAENELDLRGQLAIMLGSSIDGWKPRKTDSGEDGSAPDVLDANCFALARELEASLSVENDDIQLGDPQTISFGEADYTWRAGEWCLSRAALRGFREIREGWLKLYNEDGGKPAQRALEQVVKDLQADDKKRWTIGSVPLFLHLCEERYWPLWLDSDSGDEEDSGRSSFLQSMLGFHRRFSDWQRSLEAIHLTPAEPVHSRRLYMFSDLKDKLAKVVYGAGSDESTAQCAIAYKGVDGQVVEARARLKYSAKRLLRDELQGGEDSRWLQPMTRALGLKVPQEAVEPSFSSAMSLMPDLCRSTHGSSDVKRRYLLNFPVSLEVDWIHQAVGRSSLWRGQFNGTRDKHIHLHWAQTIKGKAGAKNPWWTQPKIINEGFTTLSVDLGIRTAGAYALLRVTCKDPREGDQPTKRPVRTIGFDGERHWYAEVLTAGIIRLPGEGNETSDNFGGKRSAKFETKGRPSLETEWLESKQLAEALMADSAENWVGKSADEKRLPEQNDSLIALANRRLTRLNTFHRWSCFDPDRVEVAGRRDAMINKLKDELAHWRDETVQEWASYVDKEDFAAFRKLAGEGYVALQVSLGQLLLQLANRTAPLRDRFWQWQTRAQEDSEKTGLYGELVDSRPQLSEAKSWIRGQRGLSLKRIEQLENLRKLFLRYNRSFDRKAGQRAKFGFNDRGRQSGEPCRLLLDKINRMKDERINQTAHWILAQALGVQLTSHSIDSKERKRRDIHGEYERIPGREPVDFITIENLDRYLTSQGRAPSENSSLMKWAHRAVRDKIKMLAEEPFGIPVLEAAAAYSSKFSAKTGCPGARCEERASLGDWLRGQFQKRAETKVSKAGQASPEDYKKLIQQFDAVEAVNRGRMNLKKPVYSLLCPKPGGALFLPLDAQNPWQADINAAMNVGLRGVAAPEAFDLLHKIRTEKSSNEEEYSPVQKNAREKAAFENSSKVILTDGSKRSLELTKASSPNFFYNHDGVVDLDKAELYVNADAPSVPAASGIGIWSKVNSKTVQQIVAINSKRLAKWGVDMSDPTEEEVEI